MGRMRAVRRAGTSAPMMATPNTAAMPAAITPGEALAVTEVRSWEAPPNGPPWPPGRPAPPPGNPAAPPGMPRPVEAAVVVVELELIRADAMPPLARHKIDTAGVQLLTDWINGLTSCN